uniref:Uncharacterized protein n=1 Tax=Maylandia zebra TaxID=106582 RepID=A0A3P9C5Q7_9CICH
MPSRFVCLFIVVIGTTGICLAWEAPLILCDAFPKPQCKALTEDLGFLPARSERVEPVMLEPEPLGPALQAALEPLGPALQAALEPLGPALQAALEPLGPALQAALEPLGPALQAALEPLGPALQAALEPLGPALQAALEPLGPALQAALEPLGPALQAALEPLGPQTSESFTSVESLVKADKEVRETHPSTMTKYCALIKTVKKKRR